MRLIDADVLLERLEQAKLSAGNNDMLPHDYVYGINVGLAMAINTVSDTRTIAPSPNEPSNEPLTFGELLKMESEPVWCVGKDKKSRSWWGLVCVEGSTVWVVDSDIRSTLVAWKGKLVDTEIKAVYRRKPDTEKEM